MPWSETTIEKPAGMQRIAFVGDSFTMGLWATTRESSLVGTFATLGSNGPFETLNFGVGGYGLDDDDLLIREEVMRFSPDYVVLIFFNGNDFRDTYLGLDKYVITDGVAAWNEEHLAQVIPYTITRAKGSPWASARGLLRDTATYRMLSVLKRQMELRLSPPPPPGEFVVSSSFLSFTYWSQVPYPDLAGKAVDVSLERLERMHEFLSARNVRLFIAAMPFREQVYAASEHDYNYDINLPQAYVAQFASAHDIPYLDLLPPLREYVKHGESIYVDGDPHLNDAGHRIAGELVYSWFTAVASP